MCSLIGTPTETDNSWFCCALKQNQDLNDCNVLSGMSECLHPPGIFNSFTDRREFLADSVLPRSLQVAFKLMHRHSSQTVLGGHCQSHLEIEVQTESRGEIELLLLLLFNEPIFIYYLVSITL